MRFQALSDNLRYTEAVYKGGVSNADQEFKRTPPREKRLI
jgi:hypothetical protein